MPVQSRYRLLLIAALAYGGVLQAQKFYTYVGQLGTDSAVIAWGTTRGINTIGRSSPPYGKAVLRIGGNDIAVRDRNYVVVRGLQPDTRYPYELFLDGNKIANAELRTWPVRSDKLVFFAIGDWGSGDTSQFRVARAMWQEYLKRAGTDSPPRFVITTGDNLYGRLGFTLQFRNTGSSDVDWESRFFAPNEELIARLPFMPSLGNHDGNETEDRGDLAAYLDNFFFPSHVPARYYRFSYGGLADFFALDSTLNTETGPPRAIFAKGGDQHRWLLKNLAQSEVPWKIPYFHHPPFNAGPRHPAVAATLAHFMQAFQQHGVRVVFCGHEHNFQFTADTGATGGVRYVVTGAGGELRAADVRPAMTAANIEGWAPQLHFLVVEIQGNEMKITPTSFEPVKVFDRSGRKIEMPLRVRLR